MSIKPYGTPLLEIGVHQKRNSNMCPLSVVALASLLPLTALAVPYAEYILAPSQRDLSPVSVHQANGTVINAAGVTTSGFGGTTFNSVSAVTYDYTKNIGGLVSFVVSSSSDSEQYIGISFTESSMWISPDGSDATQNIAIDETLWFKITGPGNYSVEPLHDRGGFRYLNVYHNSTGNVTLSHLQTYFTAMPHFPDDGLREYTGYFHSNDEKLNRVWYAGMYPSISFSAFPYARIFKICSCRNTQKSRVRRSDQGEVGAIPSFGEC